MAYTANTITEHLLGHAGAIPWTLAPEALQDAAAAADKAIVAHLDAAGALEDAELGVPMSKAAWDVAGKAAIRAGDPLPSRDPLDTADFVLGNAQDDLRVAVLRMNQTRGALAGLLSDPDMRDTWRHAIEARVVTTQAGLGKIANTLGTKVAEVSSDLGFTHYLGAWGDHLQPGVILDVDPTRALRKLVSSRPWAPPVPIDTESRWQQPTEADTRPAVWIVNDEGGIVDTTAAHADRLLDQPGFRLATDEEATRQAARNAGRR